MKLPRLFFCLLFGLLNVQFIHAQVTPPLLQCINNDTLNWANTPITCGPFLATQVYMAETPAGPYTEIATITDPVIDQYFDSNPTGQLRYYYLQYRYDCPGNPVLTSDTLDNRIPNRPNSTWVSVEGNNVVINWTASTSIQTSGYRIYRVGLTEEVIGQVSGAQTTTFTDNSFSNPPPPTTYYVQAIDDCDNSSLLGEEVTTPSLILSGGSSCASVINLTADAAAASSPLPYFSWELFVSVDGGPFGSVGMFGGGTTNFTYDQANDGEELCFYAEGEVQGQLGRPVRTTVACVNVAITQPVRLFSLFGAGFDATGNLTVDFEWDANAAVTSTVATLVNVNSEAMTTDLPFNSFMDPEATTSVPAANLPNGTFSLSLRADDACDNVVVTNSVSPVFLSNAPAATGTNALVWTPFANGLMSSVSYALVRTAIDGTQETVYSGTETTFSDRVGTNDANLALACYQVVARVTFPDGSMRSYNSLTVCQEQVPLVYLPNVFSLSATNVENREFCPGFSLVPSGDYRLDIYDRWGGHRFSSDEPSNCWDGTSNGRLAETGVYLYVLRMDIGGQQLEKVGEVVFLK